MRDQINDYATTAVENFGTTSDRVLDAILDGNRQVVDVVVKTADQVAEQLPEMPWADRFPTPAEAGTTYMEWVEKAVDTNRDFNRRVIDMLTDEQVVAPAPKPAAAKKPAAKKASAKTSAKKPAAKKASAKTSAKTETSAKAEKPATDEV